MPSQYELDHENRKMMKLRMVVDFTSALISRGHLHVVEMIHITHITRAIVLQMFPDKDDVYDLIYKTRFERLIVQTLSQN